ncbi:MAG: beta strand repeat-containing protein, partial [Roseimicrobium sp.]
RTVTLQIASNDPNESPYTLELTGFATAPNMGITGNGQAIVHGDATPSTADHSDFGPALIGGSITRRFTVRNTGDGALHFSGTAPNYVTVTGGDGSFAVTSQPASGSVAPGGSADFEVTFTAPESSTKEATISIANNDAGKNPYTFGIRARGTTLSTFAFSAPTYTVNQGTASVSLTVTRTGGVHPTTLTLDTNDGTTSAVPPFSAGLGAGTARDYIDLVGAARTVSFAEGEVSKVVTVTLAPKTGSQTNKRFTAALSAAVLGVLGSQSTTTVQILADDSTPPTLTVTNPSVTTPSVSVTPPFVIQGSAGDARGVERVTVSLNGGLAVSAPLGAAVSALAMPWSLSIVPVEGSNTLEVKAYDLRGNVTTVTRTFTFSRRYTLAATLSVPASTPADAAASLSLTATPSTDATSLTTSPTDSAVRLAEVLPGTTVSLTATPKTGYTFSSWTNVPAGAVVVGDTVTITMPAENANLTAVFIANPFTVPPGMGTGFYGLIRPVSGTARSVATEGYLTGTMNATTAVFTGSVLLDGATQAFTATFQGNGEAVFTVGSAKLPSLSFGGKTLTLTYNAGSGNDAITATVTNGAATSTGVAKRARYSATGVVPATLLNISSVVGGPINRGSYTVAFPSQVQSPAVSAASYAQGDGYATVTLTDTGVVTLAGTLADGSTVSVTSALVAGNECPIFAQLVSPGQASTVKRGVFLGTLAFDSSQANSDLTGSDLVWIRPDVSTLTPVNTAAARAAADLYTAGWPSGVNVGAVGAFFDKTKTVQAALDTNGPSVDINGRPLAYEDGKLVLTQGKLSASITKQNFVVAGSTVTKIPTTDVSYTLAVVASSGAFSGTFAPNWASPAASKPAFKGIMLQKGAHKGGHGYFVSNATGDADPQAGDVGFTLEPNTAATSPLALTSHTGGSTISATAPQTLQGTAGDARGLARVEVVVNGANPVNATLGAPAKSGAVPFTLAITPALGENTVIITAVDLRGNRSSTTLTFNFLQRFLLTVNRSVPSSLQPDTVGLVTMTTAPSNQSTALTPTTANANPRTAEVQHETLVTLTATPQAGYGFSRWLGLPPTAVTLGTTTTFAMPTSPLEVTAVFVGSNVFAGAEGSGSAFHGLIRPVNGTATSNATVGYLSGTLTAAPVNIGSATGDFTGTLQMDGASQAISATVYGSGEILFNVGTEKQSVLAFNGRTLTLSYNAGLGNDAISIAITSVNGSSTGIARRCIYNASTNPPTALLNLGTSGFVTMGFPSKAQSGLATSMYPQGDCYGTLTISSAGLVTVTATLADGNTVTGTSSLVQNNECPIYVQVVTPGAAPSVKGGSFSGVLRFDTSQSDSDVTATDFLWLRPAVTEVSGSTANALATQLYTEGWPNGITLDAVGSLFDTSATAQTTMGLGAPDATLGNATLVLAQGKLTAEFLRDFNVSGNTATKLSAADASYALSISPSGRVFSGTFTPNWASLAPTKPAFKGVFLQKGTNRGGFGFFLSNAVGDMDPESGVVTLGKKE